MGIPAFKPLPSFKPLISAYLANASKSLQKPRLHLGTTQAHAHEYFLYNKESED